LKVLGRIAELRICDLLLQRGPSVGLSVTTLQKWLNWSRCRFGSGLGCAKRSRC